MELFIFGLVILLFCLASIFHRHCNCRLPCLLGDMRSDYVVESDRRTLCEEDPTQQLLFVLFPCFFRGSANTFFTGLSSFSLRRLSSGRSFCTSTIVIFTLRFRWVVIFILQFRWSVICLRDGVFKFNCFL